MLMTGVNAVAESLSSDRKAADDLSVFQIKGRNDRLEPIAQSIDHAIAEWTKTLVERPLFERLKPFDGFGYAALSRFLESSAEGEVMLKNLQDARGVYILTSSEESAPLAGPSTADASAGPNASFSPSAAVEMWCGTVGDLELSVCHGNIVTHPTKAIVNAANEKLNHKGGVALAIANAAGRHLVYECEDIVQASGNVPVGSAVVTGAYKLSGVDYVIHAVGPIYDYRGMSWDALYRKTIRCALQQVGVRIDINTPHSCDVASSVLKRRYFRCIFLIISFCSCHCFVPFLFDRRQTTLEPRVCPFHSSAAASFAGLTRWRLS